MSNNIDRQYLDLVKDILENGSIKSDRTGTGTKSVFGRTIRHSMKDGFPLLTTKKVPFKTMVTELLYFLRGETSIKFLVENGCNIWNGDLAKYHGVSVNDYIELAKNDDNLYEGGPIYPHQWRHFGSNNYNRKRTAIPFKTNFEKIEVIYGINDPIIGKTFSTKDYGNYTIIDKVSVGEKNETYYKIQYENTNSIKLVRKDKLNSNVVDVYAPSKHGVACVGNYDNTNPNCDKLKILWNGMIDRCYNPKKDKYPYYGGKGVSVENNWLCFEYFLNSVEKLPNWELKLNNWDDYQLDKDAIGNGYLYSLESCCWLHRDDNMRKKSEKYKYTITNGSETQELINHVSFIEKYKIKNQGNFSSMLRGERPVAEGWKLLKKEKLNSGVDQITNIINELKLNPDSRRLMVTAWNPYQMDDLCLPPCHYSFQFYTRELSEDERYELCAAQKSKMTAISEEDYIKYNIPKRAISLSWQQRSVDVGLGLPFNIASYALLLTIVAESVNMVPEEVVGNLGDCHIYNNHIEGLKEQLTRTPYELPRMNINTEFWPTESGECGVGPLDATAIFNSFTNDHFCRCLLEEDIQLYKYQYHPAIKLPLSN